MSVESLEWLEQNVLVGYTERRGNAWHWREGVDNHFPGAIPVEVVRERLFNWQAVEGTITAMHVPDDGMPIVTEDKTRKAIMRSDTGAVLGIFKQGYRPHQYDEWLVRNVESLLDADLAIGSAGLLSGGAVGWVQVEMEDTVEAAEGIEFRPFLTAATSLDGSLSSSYITGAQVVVCDNTLSLAMGTADTKVKIRHSRNSMGRIGEVREALGIVHQTADAFMEEVATLTSQYVSDDTWREFVTAYCNPSGEPLKGRSLTMAENKAGVLARLWHHDARVAPWKNSAWGVLAAVNTAVHHEFNIKGMTRAERNSTRTVRDEWAKVDQGALALLAKVS